MSRELTGFMHWCHMAHVTCHMSVMRLADVGLLFLGSRIFNRNFIHSSEFGLLDLSNLKMYVLNFF